VLPFRGTSAEKWADGNLMKLKGKSKILHMGRNKPMYKYKLGTNQLESSFSEKDPRS